MPEHETKTINSGEESAPTVTVPTVKVPHWDENKKTYVAGKADKGHLEYFQKVLTADQTDPVRAKCERIWRSADEEYEPHELRFSKDKRLVEQDERTGWRGSRFIEFGKSNWQEMGVEPNLLVKIQIAMSIIVDRLPASHLKPESARFEKNTEMIKALHKRSWSYKNMSMQQLKLFAFNLAKYGWAVGRTYPYTYSKQVFDLKEHFPLDPSRDKYEEITQVDFDDVKRSNMNPWYTWLDHTGKPGEQESLDHWSWYLEYTWDKFYWEFKDFPNFDMVQPGGLYEKIRGQMTKGQQGGETTKKQTEGKVGVYFHESVTRDLFLIRAGSTSVLLNAGPLPRNAGNKRLSCWDTHWNLRNTETRLGIGLWEIMQFDSRIRNKFRNMTVDQLVLSIYKMFFYNGSSQVDAQGQIKLSPGVGRQVLDPSKINFVEIPPPGSESWKGMEWFENQEETVTGIGKTLSGSTELGKTAFQSAQAKEASLKRLKTPVDNIADALAEEAYTSFGMYEEKYSTPEIITLVDPNLVQEYMAEIKSDPALWQIGPELDDDGQPVVDQETGEVLEADFDQTTGQVTNGVFQAKIFPEFSLAIEEDKDGNFVESEEERFFRAKPDALQWEGIVVIDGPSMLSPFKELEKQQMSDLANIILPFFIQDPTGVIYKKPLTAILKTHDQKPEDWFPDAWLAEQPAPAGGIITPRGAGGGPLVVPQGGGRAPGGGTSGNPRQGLVSKVASSLGRLNPFKK